MVCRDHKVFPPLLQTRTWTGDSVLWRLFGRWYPGLIDDNGNVLPKPQRRECLRHRDDFQNRRYSLTTGFLARNLYSQDVVLWASQAIEVFLMLDGPACYTSMH